MPKIVKNTTIISPIDLIAPHSCRGCSRLGSPLCERCKNYILSHYRPVCPYCKVTLDLSTSTAKNHICLKSHTCHDGQNHPPAYVVGERSGLLDLIIHAYKYDSVRALTPHLAALLDARLPVFPTTQKVVIVPLPTATHHIRARGFDHTLRLAKKLAYLRDYIVKPILVRAKNTTQVGASKDLRLKQAISAYELNKHLTIDKDTLYLLLDDVSTTGASILAAEKKLRDSGAHKIAISLLAVSTLD